MVHERLNTSGAIIMSGEDTTRPSTTSPKATRIHESQSESAMFQKWMAITKSANDLRTMGDCCARRQSLGKIADTTEQTLRKSIYRRSDSFLFIPEGQPVRTCTLCEGSRVDSDDTGLCFNDPPSPSHSHTHSKRKNTC
ncbi:uncharacterized protein LOC120329257 [Styela clava]